MSAVAARTAPTSPGWVPAGTAVLAVAALRRERRRLIWWVLGVGGIAGYAAVALGSVYPTAADRQARAALIDTPVGILLSGPGYGIGDYTLGAMIANELTLSVMVGVAIMAISLVVRLTRAEEESGRAELVRAGAVDRRAPVLAALAVTGGALLAVAVVFAGVLVAAGFAAVDSLALAAGVGLTGLVFGGAAAVTAQLAERARVASGSALGALAVAVVVRGVGDLLRHGGSAVSWLSPIAWAQQTRAFVDLRWQPLALSVVLSALLARAAYALAARRDLGAGLFGARPGPAAARPWLTGPGALTARLQAGSLAGWGTALVLLGLTFGSLADRVVGMVSGNARLAAAFATGGAGITDSFFAAISRYLAVGVAAFAVGSVLRLRAEETAGHVELLLAGAVGRVRLLGSACGVAVVGSVLLSVAAALATGIAAAAARGDAGLVGSLLGASLGYLPAVLVTLAVAAVLVGWVPRAAGLAWLLLTWELLAAMFGPLLGLPGWALRLSPFGWGAALPAEPFDVVATAGLLLVAVVLLGSALAGFRRRDVPG